MNTDRDFLSLIALLVVMMVSTPALADDIPDQDERPEQQQHDVSSEDRQRAQELFNQGAGHYYEGQYGQAIVHFRRAHQRAPHPLFLHNIAMSHHQLSRTDRTLSAAIRARNMDTELPPEAAARNSALIAATQSAIIGENLAVGLVPQAPAQESVQQPHPPDGVESTEAPSAWGGLSWTGAALAGLGAAGLGGAAIIDVQIRGEWNDYLDASEGASEQEFEQLRSRLSTRQTVGNAMLYSGIGLAAVGGGLIVWQLVHTSGSEETMVSAHPSAGGMELRIRW